jgi:hypothetical protein
LLQHSQIRFPCALIADNDIVVHEQYVLRHFYLREIRTG